MTLNSGGPCRFARRFATLAACIAGSTALAGPAAAAPLLPTGNLLANPGAEQGQAAADETHTVPPPGWSASPGITQVAYGSPAFPGTDISAAIGGGNAFFAGGPSAPFSNAAQTVDLAAAATAIDAGRVKAVLSGALGGFGTQEDRASVAAEFHDILSDGALSTLTIGPVSAAERANVTTLLRRTSSGTVPPGTRTVNVILSTERLAPGPYNDGYADNLSLTLRAVPLVHTTGADQIATSSARINGSVDDGGSASSWRIEYGTTTAYGSRTADVPTSGEGGARAVQPELGGLSPGTDYHARVVADGPDGPVAGEDVTFRTTPAGGVGLPAGLDFTWTPHAEVLIAGAPAGGVQFQATPAPGVGYAWDFDFHDGDGFRPDPSAAGAAPRHGFTADGAHDTKRVTGADGERRRLYTVRLRATAADGEVAEVVHDLVVMPNSAPKVDFMTRRDDTGVNHPVTFTPIATDPDQGPRTADQIDHIEWDFDPPAAGGQPDLICAPDGSACHLPDSGAGPGPWFSAGDGHQAVVNFFTRGLTAHGLAPLSTVDLDALPTAAADGRPLAGAIGVRAWTSATYWIEHDPRLSYLYDNATLLQQSSFNLDAGEATGAQLNGGRATLRRASPFATKIQDVPYAQLLAASFLRWREVTLTAVDSAGQRSSVTHTVPLVPEQAPKLRAQFVNRDPNGTTAPVFRPGRPLVKVPARAADSSSQKIDYPLTTADELAFDASASSDPDGSIAYYTLEVGTPMQPVGLCTPKGPPLTVGGNGPISLDGPADGYGPGQFFPSYPGGGTGPGQPIGAVGSLPGPAINPRGLQKGGFRAALPSLPTLATLMATHPVRHDCAPYVARNVIPGPFKVRGGGAAARPLLRASTVPSPLLTAQRGLEFDTTALVTRDPADLRFRIPTPGTYSVAVSAYDDAGLGATQRTDGFVIVPPTGTCQNIAGQSLAFAGRDLGFSGQCMDYSGNHRRFWTTGEIDLNGVGLRPAPGAALYIQLDGSAGLRLFATRARKPAAFSGDVPLSEEAVQALADDPGPVDVVIDGEPVARFAALTPQRAAAFIRNDHAAAPVIPAGASYHGSPVARPDGRSDDWGAFGVTFQPQGRVGASSITFNIVLPAQFSRDDQGTSPTAKVTRPGFDEPRSAQLETNTYADIARRRHRSKARAHAAFNVAGTLDLSGTTLGPVTIRKGSLEFDVARGLWKGDIDEALLTLGPKIVPVTFHILIDNGALKEARGSAGVQVIIFTGVILDEVRFSIVTDPLTMSGGATFSFGAVLKGDLDLTVRVDPVFLRLQGRVRMASLELGGGFVQYDVANGKALTFGGHFGVNFGPASLRAELQGGISFETGDFYIQGGGHACLWICLDVQALASNIAVAGCGSIDLFVGSVSAGLAYRFGEGLDVFTGCDLEPYKPAVFRTRAAAPAAPGGLTVPAGTEQVAFKFHGDPALPGAPRVSLTAPDGRVFTTAALPGDYVFSPPEAAGLVGRPAGATKAATALIDQDPVDHVSTVLVAHPAAGQWHVEPAAGAAAPVSVELAVGRHVADAELQAQVVPAKLSGSEVKIGARSFRSGAARGAATKIGSSVLARLHRVAPLERSRLRGAVVNVPAGLTGKMTIIDASAHGSTVVRTFDVATTNGKVPIAFDPSTEPGPHELRAFLTHADGVPRQQTVIDRFTAPALPRPSAPRLSLHRSAGGAAYVDVEPGTAGPVTDPAASFELVVVTSAGERIERIVDGRAARALGGGRFRVELGTLAGKTVKLSARMRYGSAIGRVATDSVRARARRHA